MDAQPTHRRHYDPVLIAIPCALVLAGLVMVFSTSAVQGGLERGDPFAMFLRQAVAALAGLACMGLLARLDTAWLQSKRVQMGLVLGTAFVLILVLLPGVGHEVNGARSWFRFLGISLQPSEFARLVLICYLAYIISKRMESPERRLNLFTPPMIVFTVFFGLEVFQNDLGTALTLALSTLVLLFLSGLPWKVIVFLAGGILPVCGIAWWQFPHIQERMTAYLDPWSFRDDAGYSLVQSYLAVSSGGAWGQGLGASKAKLFYLPHAHNDFIFSILAEEWGFIGALLVAGLFIAFTVKGFAVAYRTQDSFAAFLALGMTSMVGVQAVLNIGIALGLFPTSGITLPFISYGGTSLIANCCAVGLLLAVARER